LPLLVGEPVDPQHRERVISSPGKVLALEFRDLELLH